VSPALTRELEALAADRVSGAVALALRAIDLALAADAGERGELAAALAAMHPAIVTVANVGRRLRAGASREDLQALRRSLAEGNAAIAREVARLAPAGGCVVTLSDSSTVEAALRLLRPKRVLVLESNPGGEGARFAARIGGELLPDAAMATAARQADFALVGVDAFDDAGAVLHKLGTLPLALACRRFGKPLYAAGHSFKRATVPVVRLLEAAGANAPFEITPPDLLSALVTETGPRV
jgi:translation initiation factor 2B subunit (eIF-2B alpha/beta/delta family)